MAQVVHYPQAAFNYAKALMELAEEHHTDPAALGQELKDLRKIVDDNEAFRLYLGDPAIGVFERAAALQRIFQGKVMPLVSDLMRLLNERGRLRLLVDIAGAFDVLLEEKLGKVEVDVTVAKPLDDAQMQKVRKSVSAALRRDAVTHQFVDESIIGGLLIRVEDRLIDASVRHQLWAMKEKLLASQPHQASF
jgi:F-type H+-transporting ATPase subunit delta